MDKALFLQAGTMCINHHGDFIMKKMNLVLGAVLAGVASIAVADSLFVDATGKVGVGSNTPATPLHVVGSPSTIGAGNAVLKLENAGALAFQFDDSTNNGGGNSFWNFTGSAGDAEFRISRSGTGATEMVLDSSGNLTVAGDIVSGGTTVVPDYVFSEDYQLKSLGEVEKFIEENSHLPNIPSAKDYAQAGGINVSELQMKMLEKVEELTLYTIQQEKTIRSLQAKVEALSSSAK
jgi:hypothetical protein